MTVFIGESEVALRPRALTILGEMRVLVAPVSHMAFCEVYTFCGISPF